METIATIVLTALRLFFLLPSSAIVLASLISPLRNRFFLYGPRAVGGGVQKPGDKREKTRDALTGLNTLLDHLASYQVPHGYFFHFYVFSTTCSIFWLSQLATGGSAFRFIAQSLDDVQSFSSARNQPSMSSSQVYFCLMLMLLQGSRRLYECLTLTKGSRSQMWIAHWLFGLSFYAAINIAVWIEGIPSLSNDLLLGVHPHFSAIRWTLSSPTTLLATVVFLLSSWIQHTAHVHLSQLPKNPYGLPNHRLFAHTLTPHYLAEIFIYVSLAVIAAPSGQPINITVLSGAYFVAANLGVTAKGTREWYVATFGSERLRRRWAMIPGVF